MPEGKEVYPEEFLGTAVQKGGGLSSKGKPLDQSLGTLNCQIFSLLGLWRSVGLAGVVNPSFDRFLVEQLRGKRAGVQIP